MLDVSYAYSPLTGEYLGPGQAGSGTAAPGQVRSGTSGLAASGSARDLAGAGQAGADHDAPVSGQPAGPCPGDRFPDRASLPGLAHHLLLFGTRESAATERLRRRWRGLVEVSHASRGRRQAGLDGQNGPAAVLVRPDGYIGFRALPADQDGLEALDAHLRCYLTPA
jgi:hypothetical protein